jgi:hypothetical protein
VDTIIWSKGALLVDEIFAIHTSDLVPAYTRHTGGTYRPIVTMDSKYLKVI